MSPEELFQWLGSFPVWAQVGVWLAGGFAGFWIARTIIHSADCRPVTIGTLIGCLFAMLIAPATVAFSILCVGVWVLMESVNWLKPHLNVVVFNPCRWFGR